MHANWKILSVFEHQIKPNDSSEISNAEEQLILYVRFRRNFYRTVLDIWCFFGSSSDSQMFFDRPRQIGVELAMAHGVDAPGTQESSRDLKEHGRSARWAPASVKVSSKNKRNRGLEGWFEQSSPGRDSSCSCIFIIVSQRREIATIFVNRSWLSSAQSCWSSSLNFTGNFRRSFFIHDLF